MTTRAELVDGYKTLNRMLAKDVLSEKERELIREYLSQFQCAIDDIDSSKEGGQVT